MSDEVSRTLGKLEAQADTTEKHIGVLFRKLDQLLEATNEVAHKLDETANRQVELEKKIEEDVMPTVKDYRKLRLTGLGIIAGVGLLGSGLGAGWAKVWKFFGFS